MITPQNRPKNIITVFTDGLKALQFIKEGNLAYVGESNSIHAEIRRNFSTKEICETKKKNDMNSAVFYVLSKQSQYSEAFRIALLQAKEAGLVDRTFKFFYDAMPICQQRAAIYSVPLFKVRSVFYLLAGEF